jgi:endonuclease/exonuclease/phosphatase family metal-dependent hydrolase
MRHLAVIFFTMLPFTGLVVSSSGRVSANPAAAVSDRTISAVSLNLAKVSDSDRILRAIQAAPRLQQADVYLFQEVFDRGGKKSVADETAQKLGYSAAFAPAAPGVPDQGLAIVSRYPIVDVRIQPLKVCDLRFRSRTRFAIASTLQTPWGDVRVWNVHLDTRINPEERLAQLQPVIDDAGRHPGPRLIGGDLNTNELYWVGNVLPLPFPAAHGATIRTAMKRHGFDTPFLTSIDTFPPFRRHLDWIFLSEMKSLGASVEPAPFSDHNAIWVNARL